MMLSLKELFFSFIEPEFSGRVAINLLPNLKSDSKDSREIFHKTYQELFQDVLILIQYFSKENIHLFNKQNQTIALIGNNSYEWILAFWAAIITGNKVALIDSHLSAEEIKSIISNLGISSIFASPEVIKKCEISKNELCRVVCLEGREKAQKGFLSFYDIFEGAVVIDRPNNSLNFHELIEKIKCLPFDVNKEIIFLHTSGTTTSAKVVGLTSKNLLSMTPSIASAAQVTPRDVILTILPLHHAYGLVSAFIVPLFCHISLTLLNEVNSQNILKAIRKTRVTIIPAVPAFWKLLYDNIFAKIRLSKVFDLIHGAYLKFSPEEGNRIFDKIILGTIKHHLGGNLRLFVSGGAKGNNAVITFFNRLGISTIEGYGLTETTGPISLNPMKNYKQKSVGKGLGDTKFKLKKKNGQGIGEIWVKGSSVFSGYIDREDLNREIFDDEGFFNTGDMGYIDSQGHVFISGRKKDVIVLSSGKNVYPDELEEYYGKSPFIKEIALIGKEEKDSESVQAVILPDFQYIEATESGAYIPDCINSELLRLSEGLPSYKRIAGFTLVQSKLPRTTTRKFKKELIKNSIQAPDTENYVVQASLIQEPETLSRDSEQKKIDPKIAKKVEDVLLILIKKYIPELIKGKSFTNIKKLHIENELKLDSILRTELFFSVENALGIKIDISKINYVRTLEDFTHVIYQEFPENLEDIPSEFKFDDQAIGKYSFFDLSKKALKSRIQAIETKIGDSLSPAKVSIPDIYKGHIENYIGDTQIPTGIIGPIQVNGEFAQDTYYVPLATTEGALVASVHRGSMVINACGGANVKILNQQIIRSPVFILNNVKEASQFSDWVKDQFSEIKDIAESTCAPRLPKKPAGL